jgi:3-methyladenine DNA glycosylase/8-oxoguanine DNA glycosylase
MTPSPDAETTLQPGFPLDLLRTLAPLAHGPRDPTIRLGRGEVWRACRTPDGPATLRLSATATATTVRVVAWGPGASWAIDSAPGLIGLLDEPERLTPQHRIIDELARRFAGVRLPRTLLPFEALLPAICEQKVTGREAQLAFRAIVRRFGEPAAGPGPLWLPPEASVLAGQPYFAFHPLGLERRRAEVVRSSAVLAPRLSGADPAEAARLMGALPGIGPWTVAEVQRVAYGDPDAVSVGDYHLPNLVSWALAGEPRADDTRMLELLEPYRGQRGRVQRLLEASGIRPPRYGPRMSPRQIAAI